MQLHDAGQQVASRPAPNPTLAPGWINNDPSGSSPPTIADPDWANSVMAEDLVLATVTGQAMVKSAVYQRLLAGLAAARQVDVGAVNALAISPAMPSGVTLPAPASLPDGTTFWVVPGHTTTVANPTLALWGNSPITITDPLGSALPVGRIAAGVPCQVMKAGGGVPVLWLLGDPISQSLTTDGYRKFPGGLILQWGQDVLTTGSKAITFPVAFPNACFAVAINDRQGTAWTMSNATWYGAGSLGPTGFTCQGANWNGSAVVLNSSSALDFSYIAVGW